MKTKRKLINISIFFLFLLSFLSILSIAKANPAGPFPLDYERIGHSILLLELTFIIYTFIEFIVIYIFIRNNMKSSLKARSQLYKNILLINLFTFPIVIIIGAILSPPINNIIILYIFLESFPIILEILFFLWAFNFLLEREYFRHPISKRKTVISILSANIISFIFGFFILPVFFYFPLIPSLFLFGVVSLLSFLFMSFLIILFLFLIIFLALPKNEKQLNKTNLKDINNIMNHRRILLIIKAISIILFLFVLFFEYSLLLDYRKFSEPYYGDFSFNWLVNFFILSVIVLLVSVLIVLSYKEYWEYITYRNVPAKKGYHTLSIDDLFENENRKSIIKAILAEPGIHNNELLRQCNLQKGQLQWHLQVLTHYKIIRKEKIGQYTAYFPSIKHEVQGNNRELLLSKSKTKFEILNLIEDNPGINPSKIAARLNLNKSSVKYHVDKFIEEKLILNELDGRKIRLYVKQE